MANTYSNQFNQSIHKYPKTHEINFQTQIIPLISACQSLCYWSETYRFRKQRYWITLQSHSATNKQCFFRKKLTITLHFSHREIFELTYKDYSKQFRKNSENISKSHLDKDTK